MRNSASLTRVIGVANIVVVTVAIAALLLLPTAGEPTPGKAAAVGTVQPSKKAEVQPEPQPDLPSGEPPPPVTATPEFARQVKANELGLVPVIMYHRIMKKRLASIDRTPSQIRQELEKLARQGYVPITAKEFATGDIRVPAGKFPVVLTFDDGHASHFALDGAGMPKKDTAVRIIYDVARKYPSFRPVATFWINSQPFGLRNQSDQAKAVRWLTEHGFEVANHTWGHPNLAVLPKKKVQEQIVRLERLLKKSGAPPSETLALPFGSMPHPKKIARKGSWGGISYDLAGVFLAGAEPSLSPYAKKFDRGAIQRIQSNGKKGECRKWCSQYWLEWLNKHPGERFVSDGDPERISIPRKTRGNITPKRIGQVNAY
ncbi:polysaccharide deacetylase family protein [Nonomuraea africana]|uniref:Peptidoglycan/xylan/chitin deacetylase (PgdA/CDA1 family) n=1 Tax=Nonomuraea africana TaxID=46171 RepID=A0ABR9KI50_9ACTN|nr:polysaccharide deacetylase family protein [Nonomuraea africana]MBE1561328.1 peptidoglycan/xylan/chitin deacetylase (PgdA/CDA1 family) [Nonomuraea africana]